MRNVIEQIVFALLVWLQMGCTLDARFSNLNGLNKAELDSVSPTPSVPSVITTLKISGNSRKSIDPSFRIFNEIDGGWTFTGDCESDNGNVSVTGDIDASISVSCVNDSFSIRINHSTTPPYFNSNAGLSRKLIATQNSISEETVVFKAVSSRQVPLIVATSADFQNIENDDSRDYILSSDIDMSNGGTLPVNNFFPISFSTIPGFTGSLDGDGHTVSNINLTSGSWSSCIFDYTGTNASIKNIKFTSMNMGTGFYGAASTKVSGLICTAYGAGLVVENVSIQGTLTSGDVDTVMAGVVVQSFGTARIENVNVDVVMSGAGVAMGGIFAGASAGAIVRKAKVNIVSTSTTKPNLPVAGIVASVSGAGLIEDSYVTGSISAAEVSGGIVGSLSANGIVIQRVYSAVNISVPSMKVGGQVIGATGAYTYTLTSVQYYNGASSCINCTTAFGNSRNLAEMKSQVSYSGWDFTNIWKIVEGISYPTLR